MLKKIIALFAALIASLSVIPVEAADCSAAAYAVVDVQTGEMLASKNESQKRSIASTTKIMTALIACESGSLDEIVTVTFDMVNTEGSVVGLRENDCITLRDIVVAMMLASGNDAANAAALFLGESFAGFADMMNKKAAVLGIHILLLPRGLTKAGIAPQPLIWQFLPALPSKMKSLQKFAK